jgi:hypothetical protein
MAMPSRQNRWAGTCVKSRPKSFSPPVLIRFNPAIALMSVLLPAPLGPTMHTNSPASTRIVTSHKAGAAP